MSSSLSNLVDNLSERVHSDKCTNCKSCLDYMSVKADKLIFKCMYLDANNLYGWAMSQKLPVNSFKWKTNMLKFNKEFIINYYKDSDKGYNLEVDVEFPKDLHNLHSDLPFLSERIKINKCYVVHSHKSFKISIRLWVSFIKKCTG